MILIIILISFTLTFLGYLLVKKTKYFQKHPKYEDYILRSLVIIYLLIVTARFFFADSFIYVINKGLFENYFYETNDYFHSFLRWATYISYGVLPIAVAYPSRFFRNVAIYICLPLTILGSIYFNDFIQYFMAENHRGITTGLLFRQVHLAIEFILAITIPLMLMVFKGHLINLKNSKEVMRFIIGIPFIFLALIPVYLPQSLVGYTNIGLGAFSLGNITWIILIVILITVLFYLFRFKSFQERQMVCVFLAIALFMHYNSLVIMGFMIKRLPFQLCNLGTYLILIALIINKKPFTNFVFIANVTGAAIAIIFPEIGNGIFGFWNYHFILEHTYVLVIPVLAVGLRVFPRLEIKAIKHFFIGFTIYFITCLIVGTTLNSFTELTKQNQVNFFYIFDLDLAISWFPFLGFTQRFGINVFGSYLIYPLFQIIVYLSFSIFALSLYWIMQKVYNFWDDNFRLRLARIELIEKITKKPSRFLKEYPQEDHHESGK